MNEELLNQILIEPKELNHTVTDIKQSVQYQHEITLDKLGTLESILDQIRNNTTLHNRLRFYFIHYRSKQIR